MIPWEDSSSYSADLVLLDMMKLGENEVTVVAGKCSGLAVPQMEKIGIHSQTLELQRLGWEWKHLLGGSRLLELLFEKKTFLA